MNIKKLHVLIVGCGNIAGMFDQLRGSDEIPLTHAGAYSQDSRFFISACIDPDEERRRNFMRAWNVQSGYQSIAELVDVSEQFDVISICSPTDNHMIDLEAAILLKPRLIFCEKPITNTYSDSARIVEKCKTLGIFLVINYTRRWDPDIVKLSNDIEKNKRGELRSINGIYNKGILNNGSHMLDIIQNLFGLVKLISVGKPVFDSKVDDPSIPVYLENDDSLPINITCARAEDYSLFELQFVFSSGMLTMEDGGFFWRERQCKKSSIFKGYQCLDDGIRRTGKYPYSMSQAIDNIYNALIKNELIASSGDSALKVQSLCEEIINLSSNVTLKPAKLSN